MMNAAISKAAVLASEAEITTSEPASSLLTDLLIGHRSPIAMSPDDFHAVDQSAAFHGVDGLIWQQLRHSPDADHPALANLCRRARQQAQWELSHRAAVADLLDRLDAARIPVLLLKGTALAYSLYPEPTLRVRGDTDLLVAPSDRERAVGVLQQAGFRPVTVAHDSDLQSAFERIDPSGARQVIDLHWAVCNSPLLAQVWTFDELHSRAQPLVNVSEGALGLCCSDALIHACLHWAINRHVPYRHADQSRIGGDRLIWLYDIKLLAESLKKAELSGLIQQLRDKRLTSLCLPALRSTQSQLPSDALATLIDALKSDAKPSLRAWAFSGGWLRRAIAELALSPKPLRRLHDALVASPESLRARYPNDDRSTFRLQLRRWTDGIARRNRRR